MITIASAPCRISLFGGGTDTTNNGLVINLAINLRTKVLLHTQDDIWSIENSVPYNASRELYHAILSHFGLGSMHHAKFVSITDANVGEGLGTSASAGVALIKAIDKTVGLNLTRVQIAEKAFEIESSLWNTGRQDVYASAFGGMNIFEFKDKVKVYSVEREIAENIKKHLFLYYIGGVRQPQIKSLTNLDKIRMIAEEAKSNLKYPEYLGELLNMSWQEKKKSNPNVSNERIDAIYSKALEAGVWGGKVLGSGGAGYMAFMAPEKPKLDLEEIDFEISWDGVEGRIL